MSQDSSRRIDKQNEFKERLNEGQAKVYNGERRLKKKRGGRARPGSQQQGGGSSSDDEGGG